MLKLLAAYIAFALAGCGMAVLALSVMLATNRASAILITKVGAIPTVIFRLLVGALLTAVFVLALLFWLLVDKQSVVLPGLFIASFVGTAALLRMCYLKITPEFVARLKAMVTWHA
jgi:hypothetical protein